MTDLFEKSATKDSASFSFDEFWSKTSKTGSKHQARKKFQSFSAQLRKQATESVEAYYRWWTKANPEASTLHVSTYLNQRRWEDDDWQAKAEAKEPSKADQIQTAVANIKSGKPYLCTSINFSQAHWLVKNGMVTEEEVRKVNKW